MTKPPAVLALFSAVKEIGKISIILPLDYLHEIRDRGKRDLIEENEWLPM